MEIREVNNLIKIYNCGVEIIQGTSYNEIAMVINKAIKNIRDVYQLNVLKEVLKEIELRNTEKVVA